MKINVISWPSSPAPHGARQYWDLQDGSHVTGNVTSPDIDFHIYFFPSKALLHHIDDATCLSAKMLSPPERMWLRRSIPTHWYVRNSDYLTYLQIVHLSKRGIYHLWASRLVVRLRSRLDAIGLLPLWWNVSFFIA